MPKRTEFIELVATFNWGDVAFIKSILEVNGIFYHIEGEIFNQIRPLAVPVTIKVDKLQYEEAKALLVDFKSGKFGFEPDKPH